MATTNCKVAETQKVKNKANLRKISALILLILTSIIIRNEIFSSCVF